MAKLIEISNELVPIVNYTNGLDEDNAIIERLNEFLSHNQNAGQLLSDLKKGDLVHLEGCGSDRNDGKFIFDGTQFCNLNYDDNVDRYGSIPMTCSSGVKLSVITEFNIDHWSKVVDLVPFDPTPFLDQMTSNLIVLDVSGKLDYIRRIGDMVVHAPRRGTLIDKDGYDEIHTFTIKAKTTFIYQTQSYQILIVGEDLEGQADTNWNGIIANKLVTNQRYSCIDSEAEDVADQSIPNTLFYRF